MKRAIKYCRHVFCTLALIVLFRAAGFCRGRNKLL